MRPDVMARGLNRTIQGLTGKFAPVVAVLEAVPEEVLGWVCREFTRQTVHYVYTKHAFRRQGVASALIQGVVEYTHLTDAGKVLFAKQRALYNPYSVYLE